MSHIVLIRHGKTQGNLLRQYIGVTDEPLCAQGEEELRQALQTGRYPQAQRLYASPLLRCQQTAALLYPHLTAQLQPLLRECDFGEFEGKSYPELKDHPAYQQWLQNPDLPFPQGEARPDFIRRCCEGFTHIADQECHRKGTAALVVHGGTIMAIMHRFCDTHPDFYDCQLSCGQGYLLSVDVSVWLQHHTVHLEETLC
ncbi:MAG: histidine phosphatase family protein [Eubacteriales bacterium]|jgi:alpha-ribazole phosphatase